MRILLGVLAALVFAVGLVAYRAAWLCHRHPYRAGWWVHPRAALALFAFVALAMGPLVTWFERGLGMGGWTGVWRGAVMIVSMLLYLPFLLHHAGELFERLLSGESRPPPDPDDPFERAKAAEEGGDVRGAIERYKALLDGDEAHLEARVRLAELLARTRRLAQAKEVVERGLGLESLPPGGKAELEALLRRWEEGKLGEDAPEGADGLRLAGGHIPVARAEADDEDEDPDER